jgi:hypothetical protein
MHTLFIQAVPASNYRSLQPHSTPEELEGVQLISEFFGMVLDKFKFSVIIELHFQLRR